MRLAAADAIPQHGLAALRRSVALRFLRVPGESLPPAAVCVVPNGWDPAPTHRNPCGFAWRLCSPTALSPAWERSRAKP